VPQRVGRDRLVDARPPSQSFHDAGSGVPIETTSAVMVQEDRSLLSFADT
jgi:hypothetical protein